VPQEWKSGAAALGQSLADDLIQQPTIRASIWPASKAVVQADHAEDQAVERQRQSLS
jgi:hypothetical protein